MAVDTKKRNTRQYAWQKENADRINAILPKGMKAEINDAAAGLGVSSSEFIRQALRAKISAEQITIMPIQPVAERIKSAAQTAGKPLEDYILDAVDAQIAFDEAGEHDLPQELLPNLIKWMREHGHSEEEILDCIQALSGSDKG